MKLAKTGNWLVVSGMTEHQYYKILHLIKDEPGMSFHSGWKAFMIPARIRVYERLLLVDDLIVDPRLVEDVAFAKRERADLPTAYSMVEKIRSCSNFNFKGYTFKTKPWVHQLRGVKLVANCKCLALLWDMRTGKTFTVANAIQYLKHMGQPHKTIVICPKHIRTTWVEDVQKHTSLKCLVLGNGTSAQLKALACNDRITEIDGPKVITRQGTPDLYITNTDAVRNKSFHRALADNKFDIAVVDESHCFGNSTSKRTRGLMEIKKRVGRRYILTGTLIARDPTNAYSQMRFVNSSLFPETLAEFKSKYCIYRNQGGVEIFVRANPKTQAELWSRIDRLSDKVRIEDCHDMPEKLYTTIYVDLTPEQTKAHNDLVEQLCTELEGDCIATTTLQKSRKLSQITSGFLYNEQKVATRFKGNPKLDALKDILDQVVREDRKVIVWAYFHETIKMIQELMMKEGLKYSLISGVEEGLTDQERHKRIWEFQHKDAPVIVANPSMLGLGINLSAAKYSVFFENDFRLDYRIQAEARNYGDKALALHGGRIVIYDLAARKSVDDLVLKSISCKKNFLDFINAKQLRGLRGMA